MEAMLGISRTAIINSTSKNALSFLFAYVFSSTKLEIKAEQFLPGSKGGWGRVAVGRNGPNNVCTCE
jgi:hypothetical protein